VCGWFAPAALSKGLIKSGKRLAFVSFGLQKKKILVLAQHCFFVVDENTKHKTK